MVRFVFRPSIVAGLAISFPLVSQAIHFSYPESADNAYSVDLFFRKGDTVNVTWDSVPTDPNKFSLYLWEFVTYPPAYELVAYDVDTEAGSAIFKVPCHIKKSPDWQLTMIQGTNVYVLYAQTARFKIKDSKHTCAATPPHPEICSSSSSYGT
ncbi:putative extracellular proline-serine rich protein [Diaporthe ampelina]|uniref:Putative extracellular proline-serine rich protein n=1 Tax=Diaporthe ampelina TaxID=1214573 RepID=A0A0G2ICV9_9PEZI|nr:putative extracellular proline-serine rich protein [Diaporthe ampelina]